MRTEPLKHAVEITEDIIDSAKKQQLPNAEHLSYSRGKWICINVADKGFVIPPTAIVFETKESAQRGADIHNRYLGYTKEESNRIIADSMGLINSKTV